MRRLAAVALLLLPLAGCTQQKTAGPPDVRVQTGTEDVQVRPSQYCLDGQPQRYQNRPPVIEAAPGSPITLTAPGPVAEQGWSVQVFDDKLQDKIGEVAVPRGTRVFKGITSSDVVPPAFYLVVVEDKGGACAPFSGAWPIGIIRAGGYVGGTPSTGVPPAG